jgi:hypothetical protein
MTTFRWRTWRRLGAVPYGEIFETAGEAGEWRRDHFPGLEAPLSLVAIEAGEQRAPTGGELAEAIVAWMPARQPAEAIAELTLTEEQERAIAELAGSYWSVALRATDTASIYIDCYEVGKLANACAHCSLPPEDHDGSDHAYRVSMPARTYRIAPSGFRQDITPAAAVPA